jgi:ribosomal protein S14
MIVRWYDRDASIRVKLIYAELNKLILKGLMSNYKFGLRQKIYFSRHFGKFDKSSSVSFYRRSCLITGQPRSVFRRFKLVRHQCKIFASNGLLIGLRKASF